MLHASVRLEETYAPLQCWLLCGEVAPAGSVGGKGFPGLSAYVEVF